MAAELSADDMARMAAEIDDHTFVFLRRNGAGLWVRDAKFIEDCADLDVANLLFADHVAGAEVLLCAVLRGRVRTVDDFEFADQPDVHSEPYASRLTSFERRAGQRRFTVYGCWDTGDSFRRYSKQVGAVDAEHAELLVRRDKTVGEFLVAAVVEGHVPVEDRDTTWATLDGRQPAGPGTVEEPRRIPWLLILCAAALVAAIVAIALVFIL